MIAQLLIGQELEKYTIYVGPKWTKIKIICSGSKLTKLKTVEAHLIVVESTHKIQKILYFKLHI